MNPVKIAEQIMACINALSKEGLLSHDLIQAKAEAMGEYDENLAIAITTLRAQDKPITIVEKLAKGNVSNLLIAKIVAEEGLKAHYSKLDRLKAQLNGLQSINRYLDSIQGN